ERHALRHALIDDVVSDFSEPINVRFARTKVAALNSVVEQTVYAISIVLIVFCRIDTALCCNRMGTSRRILKTKAFHPVSEFTEGRRGGSAGKPAADDYDLKLSPVVWADQSRMVLMISPFLIQRPRRNLGIQCSNHAVKCLKTCRNVIPIGSDAATQRTSLRAQTFHLDPIG